MLETIRDQLHRLHLELPKNQLVVCSSGNISLRDPASGLVAIKPSGVFYSDLRPEDYVIVDLQGRVMEGKLKPSSDTASHLHVYRQRSDINAIVHTHSPYATAFAAVGESIPVCLTAIADEFGGPIPCSEFALIGSEEIGREILACIGTSPAVLLKQHGVICVGKNGHDALRVAVIVEEVAKTVWLARQLGSVGSLDAEDVARLHARYQRVYGQ